MLFKQCLKPSYKHLYFYIYIRGKPHLGQVLRAACQQVRQQMYAITHMCTLEEAQQVRQEVGAMAKEKMTARIAGAENIVSMAKEKLTARIAGASAFVTMA
jgi:hypothetical protein